MERFLDYVADTLAIEGLQRNRRPVRLTSFLSLGLLFAPGVIFIMGLWLLKDTQPGFTRFNDFFQYPWQVWGIGLFGIVATLGGMGDWLFHKVYITVGPNEHRSHMWALSSGGMVFILMALASLVDQPLPWLLPVIVALLTTVTLICYDEFAFHVRRCKPFETLLHRLLVFGNGLAFLCWLHWIFVAGGINVGA